MGLPTFSYSSVVTGSACGARAHLNEFPGYYTRLAKMEAEAEADWTTSGD